MARSVRSSLTGDDIVKIIAACKDAGVHKFCLAELVIEFASVQNEPTVQYVLQEPPEEVSGEGEGSSPDLESLLIEDPLAYETAMLEGKA